MRHMICIYDSQRQMKITSATTPAVYEFNYEKTRIDAKRGAEVIGCSKTVLNVGVRNREAPSSFLTSVRVSERRFCSNVRLLQRG